MAKKLTLIVFCCIALLMVSKQSHASHAMGADINYECIDSTTNTYRITVTFYRDCDGIAAPTTIDLDYSSISCNFTNSFTMNQQGLGNEVSPLCPSDIGQSTCNGGNLPGVEQYKYVAVVSLPFNCNDWVFSFAECCRNDQITNSTTPGSFDLYVEARLNNLDFGCNSSPNFTSLPVPFICAGQPINYNHGAVDAEGDFIIYRLVDPLDAAGVTVPYAQGFSPTNPLSTLSGNFNFDTLTGQINFTPDNQQVGIVTVLVEEYRDGVFIGSTMRDIQVVVLNCAGNSPTLGGIDNAQGAAPIDSVTLRTCPGTPVSFSISATDPDGDTLSMTSNVGISIPGASFTTTQNGADITGNFDWLISQSDSGSFTFTVTVADNGCPISGTQIVAYNVVVTDDLAVGDDTAVYCGVPVQLTAFGTNIQWTPSTGLTCDTCFNPVATPAVPTMYRVTSDCGEDSVFVNVVPSYEIEMSNDTSICLNGATNIGVFPDQAGNYTYEWRPRGGLSADSIAEPIASPLATTNYNVMVTSDLGCERSGTVQVAISGEAPSINIQADKTLICPGDTISLNAAPPPSTCNEYEVDQIPVNLIGGGGTSVSLGDDQVSPSINIGFPFTFFCNDFTQLYISSNGFITFEPNSPSSLGNQTIPDPIAANNLIAFAWDDLNPSAGGSINYLTNGAAPNRIFVVNFTSVPHFGSTTNTVTTQIQLHEGSNMIEIHTTDIQSDGGTLTMGIENSDGQIGFEVPGRNNTNWSASNEAYRFSIVTPPTLDYTWMPSVGIDDPSSAAPTAMPAQSTTYTVFVRDSVCEASDQITILVDSTFGISALPSDTNICSSAPIPLRVSLSTILDTTTEQILACDTYSVESITFAPDINIGTPIALGDDQVSGPLPIGFDFDFYCNTYSTAYLSSNGFLTFVANSPSSLGNQTIPNIAAANDLIAFAWDDLSPNNGGFIDYYTTGTAPNRRFITNFVAVPHFGNTGITVTSQLILYEGSNLIEIHSLDIQSDGGTLTQGIENADGTAATAVTGRNNANWTAQADAVRFTPVVLGTTAPDVSYNWTPGSTLDCDTCGTPIATPNSTTSYEVEVLFGACRALDTVRVTVGVANLQLSADDTVCAGQAYQLSASGGETYDWTPGETLSDSTIANPIATPVVTTSYDVTIIDSNGCQTDTAVLLQVLPAPTFSIGADTTICCEESVSLSVNPGNGTVLWSDSTTGTSLIASEENFYWAEITNSLGCPSRDSIYIEIRCIEPNATATPDIIFTGDVSELNVETAYTGNFDFSWQPGIGLTDSSSQTVDAGPVEETLYTVTVTDTDFGCVDSDTVRLMVVPPSPMELPEAFSPNGDGLNDEFYPLLGGITEVQAFKIYNRWGDLMHDDASNGWNGALDGKDQPTGTYTFYVEAETPDQDNPGVMVTIKRQGAILLLR